jgi:hypothetical protein
MGGGARLAAVATCLLIAGAAPPARAAPAEGGFQRMASGRTSDPLVTDGTRWVAYRAGGLTHVIDDRTGVTYAVRTPPRCALADVGHGVLAWECPEARGAYPVLFDMVHRRRLAVAGIDGLFDDIEQRADNGPGETPDDYEISFYDVGRQWIGGDFLIYTSHGTFGSFALNWHTGERRFNRPRRASVAPNFDSPALGQPLCSPLARSIDDDFPQRTYQPFDREGPYGLTFTTSYSKLLLERCAHRARVLASCSAQSACLFPQLGAGAVTWGTGPKALLYDVKRHRRYVFSQPGFNVARDEGVWPQHTRRSIFVSVPGGSRWRLYRRRLMPERQL